MANMKTEQQQLWFVAQKKTVEASGSVRTDTSYRAQLLEEMGSSAVRYRHQGDLRKFCRRTLHARSKTITGLGSEVQGQTGCVRQLMRQTAGKDDWRVTKL